MVTQLRETMRFFLGGAIVASGVRRPVFDISRESLATWMATAGPTAAEKSSRTDQNVVFVCDRLSVRARRQLPCRLDRFALLE